MFRIGQGYDVHKLVAGRKLILGGVAIPSGLGLLGHSDADVLAHAIMDALLGAAALGDIGKHFPDKDPLYRNADSMKLMREVCRLVRAEGYEICNIDSTVCAEVPKLSPHIFVMRASIASACDIDISQVSVKATTEEELGFTGKRQGMSATAVCLISSK
jgi:2-C-methyl-D-erythritol 2,4-cyclodiphosphate synthase